MVTKKNNRKRKLITTKKTNKNKRYTRRKQRGAGNPEIADKYTDLRTFRSKFSDLLYPLINWKSKSKNQIKTFIKNLNNFFKENNMLINTLINIDANRRPVLKDVVDFVSIPTVIMDNITNNEIKSKLLLLFYENGGNINAYNSLTGKETAFIHAVENRQLENIRILLDPRYGLSRDNLPDEIKPVFDDIIREPEIQVEPQLEPIREPTVERQLEQLVEPELEPAVEPIREQVVEPIQEPTVEPIQEPVVEPIQERTVVKLKVPINVPKVGYNIEVAPRFWRDLFTNKGIDLFALREKIRELLSQDEIHKVIYRKGFKPNAWSTCEMVESMFPAYYTRQNPEFQLKTQEQQMDFVNTNTALCIILLLLGIISNTMNDQDYNFIFKGGKSVQFVLSEIQNTAKYISDDIDILITHNEDIVYNDWKMRNIAEHISFLIKWFLEGIINISLDLPNTNVKTFGKDIVKISYLNSSGRYTALCDVGFGNISENVRPYFEHPQVFRMYNNTLEQELMFRCPNMEAILDEKLYYYLKFIQFRDILRRGSAIHEKGYEDMNTESLNFFIQKFKRSIKAIVDGLILQQSGNINQEEQRMLLQFRLNQFNANTNFKEEAIQSILNANPYEV
jgi:hypothetical protein